MASGARSALPLEAGAGGSSDAIAFWLWFRALRFRLLELEGCLDVQEIIVRVCDSGGYWQPI